MNEKSALKTLAQSQARESEKQFQTLVEASSDVIYRMSPDWSELRQLDGRGFVKEAAGPKRDWIQEYLPAEDQPLVERAVRRAIATKSMFEMEHRIRKIDGTLGWTISRAIPICDERGEIVEWLGAAQNISVRKDTEEALRRREAELRTALIAAQHLAAIVESSDDAIASKDLNGIVTSWNKSAERLFGYTADEIIGKPITTIIPPELLADETMILGKIRKGEKIDHFETVRVTKSGERVEVSLSISPVRDAQGKIVGAAKVVRDITQNKKIERALRTTEKLAAAGRLAATVAHEINNPLEAVHNLVFLAKRDVKNSENVAQYLEMAQRELDRVAHIARQTLGFYRDTSAPTTFSVVKTLEDLLFLYEKRLEVRGIRVVRQYKYDGEITALAGEIRQVLSNLISNAFDAMPNGGSLCIRISKSREWNKRDQQGIRITMLDTGTGIPLPARKRLFEPFFTTKEDVGTGLGLWITKNIVEKHHGNIRFISRTGPEDHGTAFSIYLPAKNEPENAERTSEIKKSKRLTA